MLYEFLYNQSAIVVFFEVAAFFLVTSILIQFVCQGIFTESFRKVHSEPISFALATVTLFFSVLIGFITVVSWQSYLQADQCLDAEAERVAHLDLFSRSIKEPLKSDLSNDILKYVDIVEKSEVYGYGGARKNGLRPDYSEGWTLLYAIYKMPHESANALSGDRLSEFDTILMRLMDARSERVSSAKSNLNGIVWFCMIISAFTNIIIFSLIYLPDRKFHYLLTSIVAVIMAIDFFLIIGFDRPFEGAFAIDSSAFQVVKNNLDHKPI